LFFGLFPLTEYYSFYQPSTIHSTSRTPSLSFVGNFINVPSKVLLLQGLVGPTDVLFSLHSLTQHFRYFSHIYTPTVVSYEECNLNYF
jgi:hypothetical protein